MDPKTEPQAIPKKFLCCQPRFPTPVRPSPGESQVLAAVALTDLCWKIDKITYCFVDNAGEYLSNPDEILQTKMKIVRLAWQNWKNTGIKLTFVEVDNKKADIRIAFDPRFGSYSGVGMNNIWLLKDAPHTMNLGREFDQYACTAEHEIGHALGLQHEHQNPNAGIEWNTDQVMMNYRAETDWEDWKIQRNVLAKLTGPMVGIAWDPNSIMHYPFTKGEVIKPVEYANISHTPTPYTTCRYDAATNTLISGLSAGDKEVILKLYPPVAPVKETITQEQPVEFSVPGPAEGNRVGFEFQPPVSGKYSFTIQGPNNTNPVKSTVMVRSANKNEYVLDDEYISADDDIDSRLVLPVKARPYLNANEKYVVTALFDKTAIGSVVMNAIFGKETVDIVSNLAGFIGQNMRSGITVVNKTSSDIMVSITKEIITDSAGWITIISGQQDRWGRAAKEYTIDLIVEGEQRTLEIKKEGEETIIFVKSCNDIEVYKAEVLKRL